MGILNEFFDQKIIDPGIIESLKRYDDLYYNSNKSPLSDSEYDELKETAQKMYPEHPYFQTVGVRPRLGKVKLPFILGSLKKVKYDTVRKWLSTKSGLYVVSQKLDGTSIYVEYDKSGNVVFASTRGNGYEGKDITAKAKIFCPQTDHGGVLKLRGEAMLIGDSHKKLRFKTRRNGAAGILNRDDTKYCEYIVPFFYEVIESELRFNEQSKKMMFLNQYFFTPKWQLIHLRDDEETVRQLTDMLLSSDVENYEVDGLVITPEVYDREDEYYPEKKVAFKMNERPVQTIVRDIEWNASRTGRIIPTIKITPTEIQGVSVSRATGFNAKFIYQNKIGSGSVIKIVRSGDVIPHITEIVESKPGSIPEQCPECNMPVQWSGVDIVCNNSRCNARIYKNLENYLRILGAENITEKTLRKLKIDSLEVLYNINDFDIAEVEGFGINRGKQIVEEIQKTLTTVPYKLIAAFGITGIGETVAKLITDHLDIGDNDHLMGSVFDISEDGLLDIHGIGEVTAKTFRSEIIRYIDTYQYLRTLGLKWEGQDSSISGLIFTVTGKGPMSRNVITKMVTSQGGIVKNISKKTNYLVTNDVESTSTKAKKARQYDIPIITYEELIEMLGG